MKLPISWLNEFVKLPEGTTGRDVAASLLKVGFEVESVETLGDVRGPLVVGQVQQIEELTDFKKPIRYCQVNIGNKVNGIICGARNFVEGDLVVVALPGTTLPGDFTITARETYGRTSNGMICSAREVGLGDEHDGIMVLPAGSSQPGDDAFPILGLGDEVLDISVTPDRGYALSIRGLAREYAIATGLPFSDPGFELPELPQASGNAVTAASDDREGCDLLVLHTLSNFNPAAPTPEYIKSRLAAVGVRSISLAVDVTNYVMFELGQPLHAFDADKVSGTIRARRAKKSEKLETLDHTMRDLDPEDLVIADDRVALSVAGVMGGAQSEISDTTTRIVIEAAHFNSVTIARSSRRHKLSSEASRRFERGVDRMLPPIAAARASELLIKHGGAKFEGVSGVETAPNPAAIAFDPALTTRTAGRPYEDTASEAILTSLGCKVDSSKTPWQVIAPSWRPDLTMPIDLVEEIIRIDGYDKVPTTLPVGPHGRGLTANQRLLRRIGLHLAGLGLVEVRNYPFIGISELDALELPKDANRRHALLLANPLSDEQPMLRTTLLPGLFGAVTRNTSRGFTDIGLFEIASVVLPSKNQSATGSTNPPRPSVNQRPSDKDLAKLEELLPAQPLYVSGVLTASDWARAIEVPLSLASEIGVTLTVQKADIAPWHPGRCAQLLLGDQVIGTAGELTPRVIENVGLPKRTVAFELDLTALMGAANTTPDAPRVWTFPIAKEDLAFVVKKEVPAANLLAEVKSAAGELLEEIKIFDVYEGNQVPAGHKSVAFALRFRAGDRTLSAEEVAAARNNAIEAANKKFGATLRA